MSGQRTSQVWYASAGCVLAILTLFALAQPPANVQTAMHSLMSSLSSSHLPDLGHMVFQEAAFLQLSLWLLLISSPQSMSKLHCIASIPACSTQL